MKLERPWRAGSGFGQSTNKPVSVRNIIKIIHYRKQPLVEVQWIPSSLICTVRMLLLLLVQSLTRTNYYTEIPEWTREVEYMHALLFDSMLSKFRWGISKKEKNGWDNQCHFWLWGIGCDRSQHRCIADLTLSHNTLTIPLYYAIFIVEPTYWLILARDSGKIVIHSLPDMSIVYQVWFNSTSDSAVEWWTYNLGWNLLTFLNFLHLCLHRYNLN